MRGRSKLRARKTIGGSLEAAIVIALVAGGSAFTGYPIVHAVAGSMLVHAVNAPTGAHVTETILPGGARAVVETTIRRVEPDART